MAAPKTYPVLDQKDIAISLAGLFAAFIPLDIRSGSNYTTGSAYFFILRPTEYRHIFGCFKLHIVEGRDVVVDDGIQSLLMHFIVRPYQPSSQLANAFCQGVQPTRLPMPQGTQTAAEFVKKNATYGLKTFYTVFGPPGLQQLVNLVLQMLSRNNQNRNKLVLQWHGMFDQKSDRSLFKMVNFLPHIVQFGATYSHNPQSTLGYPFSSIGHIFEAVPPRLAALKGLYHRLAILDPGQTHRLTRQEKDQAVADINHFLESRPRILSNGTLTEAAAVHEIIELIAALHAAIKDIWLAAPPPAVFPCDIGYRLEMVVHLPSV